MSDDVMLARLLRRFINADEGYIFWGRLSTREGERQFTIDGTVEVTDEELDALDRARDAR